MFIQRPTYPDPDQVARIEQIETHFGRENCQSGKRNGDIGFYGIYVRSSTRAEKGDPPPEKKLPKLDFIKDLKIDYPPIKPLLPRLDDIDLGAFATPPPSKPVIDVGSIIKQYQKKETDEHGD